jgi:ABC-type multidrug transport system ATPase subunit
VEHRKRLTIGVELVAKPSILIFLDEPTSGLDGQAAYNTVPFLRKLAEAGQAILVTIHHPSAQFFAQFDKLLLLAAGGKIVYFGDIGQNANAVKEYFGRQGAPCPPEVNPAEYIIDVVSANDRLDWNQVWLKSPEHDTLSKELDSMVAEAAVQPTAANDDPHEFATSLWMQTKLVTHRMNISLFRNTEYLNNKFAMHISLALLERFYVLEDWRLSCRSTAKPFHCVQLHLCRTRCDLSTVAALY